MNQNAPPAHQPARYVAIFIAAQIVLFSLSMLEPIRVALVVPMTEMLARVAASVVMRFDTSVLARGVLIRNQESGFAVEIAAGCNGMEPMILLVSAILAFPSALRDKLVGIAIGVLAIQLLNIVRIITLFYLGQWSDVAFDWAHNYLWPAMILVDALVVWLVWVRHIRKRTYAALA